MMLVFGCVIGTYAQKTVFKFRDAQARAGDAVTEVCVKPTVVEVKILEEKGRIKDVWTLSREEVEVAMKGELDNIRAWGTYLSTIKNDCDVIMGATFKIEDDEKSGGYTVTVVGYPGVFTNWHTATTEDYEWIRIQKLSGADDRTKIAPVIKNKNCIRHEKKGHLEIQNKRENKKVSEDSGKDKVNFKDSIERNTTSMQNTAEVLHQKEKISISQKNCGETVVLSANIVTGPATLVSREPGELATIYLQNELTVIGKMENAADAVIELPTVSRIHAKIRKREGEYYLTDLNSRNGTSVNGKILKGDEEYCLQDQDQIDFAQARYVFLK